MRSKVDERNVTVSLSVQGIELQEKTSKIQQQVTCETGLSKLEYIELRNQLHNLLDSIKKLDQQTAA